MTAYYNENDPYAAQWLENLIKEKLIAPGDVDRRSIVDVRADDLKEYTQCHFFAGIGGWSLALRLAGWPDDRPVWTGSCPCQPFSAAGKRKGFQDERHLWPVWKSLIEKSGPSVVFGEQVASAAEWLRLVRSDLEALGYAVGAMPIQAASAGADHLRDRYWFVGHNPRVGRGEGRAKHEFWCGRTTAASASSTIDLADCDDAGSQGWALSSKRPGERATRPYGVANTSSGRLCEPCEGQIQQPRRAEAARSGDFAWAIGADGKARRVKPGVRLLVDGFPGRVGLLRGFGNAIDPRPATAFIQAADEALAACPSL